jgi:hypothetical protein
LDPYCSLVNPTVWKVLTPPAYTGHVRTLVFILAIVTSPIGGAVCEVSCADHAVTGHQAAPAAAVAAEAASDEMPAGHHHHGQMSTETPASSQPAAGATVVLTSAGEDCTPISGQPATMRVVATHKELASAIAPTVTAACVIDRVGRDAGGPPVWSSPPPPSRSTIPLRI